MTTANRAGDDRQRSEAADGPEQERLDIMRKSALKVELTAKIEAFSSELTFNEERIQNLHVQISALQNELEQSNSLGPSLKKKLSAKSRQLQEDLFDSSQRAMYFKHELAECKGALYRLSDTETAP